MTTQANIIRDIAADLRAMVARIESSPATTRHRYGRYMTVLVAFAAGDAVKGRILCAALVEAGANRAGVADAYRITFGGSL